MTDDMHNESVLLGLLAQHGHDTSHEQCALTGRTSLWFVDGIGAKGLRIGGYTYLCGADTNVLFTARDEVQ